MGLPMPPRGLVADLVTPLRPDRSIDDTGLERLLKRVVPHVQAILLASPHTGEGTGLDPAQRLALLDKTLGLIPPPGVPIFVWITQDTREKTETAIQLLSQGLTKQSPSTPVFWVDTPLYYHSNRGLPDHCRRLCEISGNPILLHNDPKIMESIARPFKRRNIRTAILKELAAIEGIAGLIFYGAIERAHHYQKACRKVTRFRIYDAQESHFLDHPSMSGVASAGVSLAPGAWNIITRSSLQISGDDTVSPDQIQQLWELGEYLRNLEALYRSAPAYAIKAALAQIDLIETPVCITPQQDVGQPVTEMIQMMQRFGDA